MPNVVLNNEIKCPICTELCTRPRECAECGGLFCSACIAHLTSCPLCRKKPFVSRANRFVFRLLNNVQVKCGHCQSQVVRVNMEEHQKTCASRLRKCSIKSCGFISNNMKDAVDHLNTVHMEQIWCNFEKLPQILSPGMIITFIIR